jgi:phosphatidylglycerophosphate synthase
MSEDEEWRRINAAVKADDGFSGTFFVSPYSRYIVRWCAHHGVTPNQATVVSMTLAVMAAACFATGVRSGLIAGAVLLHATLTFDCVDGQLARFTGQFTPLGAWLDPMFDRVKEYLVFAALAYGAVRTGTADNGIWVLAAVALAVQTFRHMSAFSFGLQRDAAAAAAANATPVAAPRPARTVQAAEAWSRASDRNLLKWPKRLIVLPIGDRYVLMSVTAALFDARITFIALLVWSALAVLYANTGRILRSVA